MASVKAYVLITVPAPNSGRVVEKLGTDSFSKVTEVEAVYGEADVIAKIETDSIDDLHRIVMVDIQGLDHVESTRTFLIIPRPSRRR